MNRVLYNFLKQTIMENNIITVTREEKREIEKWILKTYHSNQNVQVDAMSLILYKLHHLEEK